MNIFRSALRLVVLSITILVITAASPTFSAPAPVTIDAFDRGYYLNTGEHFASAYNTFTGITYEGFGRYQSRSFFAFNLASTVFPVASAILRVEVEGYFGNSPSYGLSIVDVVTPIGVLLTEHGLASAEGQTIFQDLATGDSYGTFSVSPTDVGTILEVPLSTAAIADINAAAGTTFALGIFLGTSSSSIIPYGVRFSGLPPGMLDEWNNPVTPKVAKLSLTAATPIPEPSTFSLLVAGLSLLGFAARRRKQKAA